MMTARYTLLLYSHFKYISRFMSSSQICCFILKPIASILLEFKNKEPDLGTHFSIKRLRLGLGYIIIIHCKTTRVACLDNNVPLLIH